MYEDTKLTQLSINVLSMAKFKELDSAGEIDPNALYFTPDSAVVALSESTVELATNTIYNAGEMATLSITFPTADATYVSQLNFTSGAMATAFTAPDTVKWIGDDISDGAFVPATGKRYSIMFYYDGQNIRGAIQGA